MPKATRRARKRALPRDRCPWSVRGRAVAPCPPSVARPSEVRPKSASPPPILECRKMSATDECPPVRRPSDVHCLSVCRPLSVRRGIVRVPPVSSPCAAHRPSVISPWQVHPPRAAAHLGMPQIVGIRRMPARLISVACPSRVRERRRSEGRTRGKRRRDAALIRPRRERKARPPRTSSERRPCKGRVPSRICPSLARRKPVVCPPCIHSANDQRQMLEPTND